MWFNQFKVISLFLALLCLFCINIYIYKKKTKEEIEKKIKVWNDEQERKRGLKW